MRRQRRQASRGGGGDGNRWMTTYADLVTLLLAFFVLLFAMSEIDATKFRELLQGLAATFGSSGQHTDVLDGGQTIDREAEMEQHAVLSVFDERTLDATQRQADSEQDDDAQESGGADELQQLRRAIQAQLQQAGFAHVAELDMNPRGLIISIGTDSVLFDTGSTVISQTGREVLAAVAPPIRRVSHEVVVEGHTDTKPIHRPGYDNWNLSADRALAVLRRLKDVHGIAPDRLAATGYGEHRPRASNDTPAGRQRNRRVDILIAAQEQP